LLSADVLDFQIELFVDIFAFLSQTTASSTFQKLDIFPPSSGHPAYYDRLATKDWGFSIFSFFFKQDFPKWYKIIFNTNDIKGTQSPRYHH